MRARRCPGPVAGSLRSPASRRPSGSRTGGRGQCRSRSPGRSSTYRSRCTASFGRISWTRANTVTGSGSTFFAFRIPAVRGRPRCATPCGACGRGGVAVRWHGGPGARRAPYSALEQGGPAVHGPSAPGPSGHCPPTASPRRLSPAGFLRRADRLPSDLGRCRRGRRRPRASRADAQRGRRHPMRPLGYAAGECPNSRASGARCVTFWSLERGDARLSTLGMGRAPACPESMSA